MPQDDMCVSVRDLFSVAGSAVLQYQSAINRAKEAEAESAYARGACWVFFGMACVCAAIAWIAVGINLMGGRP